MAPSLVHLPNGQNLTVTPVFGGLSFKSNELITHDSAFPPGWTIVLNEEEGYEDDEHTPSSNWDVEPSRKHYIHRYKKPSVQNDHLFMSTISYPASSEFRPATSPTRQIAMMLYATLWWYFHQPEPDSRLNNKASSKTAEEGRPRGDWRIYVNREGIFKGKNLLSKLQRMGLITSEESYAPSYDERSSAGWSKMFVSRRAFWQIDPRIFLFTLSPITISPYPSGSPFSSRPSSPNRGGKESPGNEAHHDAYIKGTVTPTHSGPFQSTSNLPTFYPPHPTQHIFTNGIRHPIRPKPFRQGETFYTRYIPSVQQYLSFRVASLSPKATSRHGPWSIANTLASLPGLRNSQQSVSDSVVPTMNSLSIDENDMELLHRWMNNSRVAHWWGEDGPQSHQEDFLRKALSSNHSVPIIGCWGGKPFGYFEVYWVKEDILGKYLGGEVGDWDRGIHCLVGEEEFRGPHRVRVWLSALVHACWLGDLRTNCVMLEPRIDNTM